MASDFTAADLAAIKSAMVTVATGGVNDVEINGHSIKYKSLSELREFYKYVKNDIANGTHGTFRKVQINKISDTE